MTVIAFSRAIGPLPIGCILSEKHNSSLEITGNPIETGAEVNDHAYIKPKEVILEAADQNAALMYNALVRLQESRVPFNLVTGLTVYEDMLVKDIDADRDKDKSKILYARITCRQVIIVSTGSASGNGSSQSSGRPGGKNSGSAAKPTSQSANNPTTATRAASTVQTGDNPTSTVAPAKSQSILKSVFQ